MLPSGWTRSTVGDACNIKNHLRLPLSAEQRSLAQGSFPYFGPTGVLDHIDHYRIDEPFALIGEDGDHFLKFKQRPMTLRYNGKANVNNHAHVIGDSDRCLSDWFYYWFMHRDITPVLSRQGVGRYKLTKAGLESLELLLPPLEEQRAFVHCLDTWGQAINTMERLLANSRQQKLCLIRKLFLHGPRDSSHATAWSFVNLDAVFERVTRKNVTGNTNVLTISGARGLVSQRDYFNKSVASENLAGYTLLHKGEFAYNKSYSAGYPMGAIKPLIRHDSGVVSSLYICFRLREDVGASSDFFRHYFEAGLLNQEIANIAQEGARNHGLLNVGVADFFKLRLCIPDAEEQARIAAVINMAERKEQLIEAQVAKLHEERRAVMQHLLSGKREQRRIHSKMAQPA